MFRNPIVNEVYEQIRNNFEAAKPVAINEGLPPGTQESEPGAQPVQRTNSRQKQQMAANPQQAMDSAAEQISQGVEQVALAANMQNDSSKGEPPEPFREAQPSKPKATPQDKQRVQKVLNKLGQKLDPSEDGVPELDALFGRHQEAGMQVAEHMITDQQFAEKLSCHLVEEQSPERVTMLFTEAIQRLHNDDYNTVRDAICTHFNTAAKPVVEFVLDMANGDLSTIMEGETPEQISEGLAKRLAGLGVAAALGGGVMGQSVDHPVPQATAPQQETRTEATVKEPTNTAPIVADMARNVRQGSLGGMQQNRTQAQVFLHRVQDRVSSGKMTPDEGVDAIRNRYEISDNTIEQLHNLFSPISEQEGIETMSKNEEGVTFEEKNKRNEKELLEASRRREKALKKGTKEDPDAPAGHTKDVEATTQNTQTIDKCVFTCEQRERILDEIFG